MATFLKDRQFAVEGTLLNLSLFLTFFLIFKRKLQWTQREKVYILNLFKVPASCHSNWNLVFPWELCLPQVWPVYFPHLLYTKSGDELNHFQNILLPPGTLQLWSSCHQGISTAVSPYCHQLCLCRLLTLTGIEDSNTHENGPSNILNSEYCGLFYSNDCVL